MESSKKFREQIEKKWHTIKDVETQVLVGRLLDYAQALESKVISDPTLQRLRVSPKNEAEDTPEVNTAAFIREIDLDKLPNDVEAENEDRTMRQIVEDLFKFSNELEQKI